MIAEMQVLAQTLEREIGGFVDMFHHHAEWALATFWICSNLAQAIPTPTAGSSVGHVFLFNLAHLIAGNAKMLGKRAGEDGLIDRRRSTGSFTRQELDRMTKGPDTK